MSATARAGTTPAPIAEVVTAFRQYTIEVRGLSFWTAQTRGDVARRFVAAHAPKGVGDLGVISVEQVHDFFRSEAQRLATTSMGPVLDGMRSFLAARRETRPAPAAGAVGLPRTRQPPPHLLVSAGRPSPTS